MKTISSILLKGIIAIILFQSLYVAATASGVRIINEASASVGQTEVIRYLEGLGYTVHALKPIENSENWKALTSKNNVQFITTVLVVEGQIIGNEDVSL